MSVIGTQTDGFLIRFQRKIALNAAQWLEYLLNHVDDPNATDNEWANVLKAVQQALAEPMAWQHGLALAVGCWHYVQLRGYWHSWHEQLAMALQISHQMGRVDYEAQLLDQLGEIARLLGDNAKARLHFESALELFRTQADSTGVGRVLTHLSQVLLALGDYDTATQCSQEAVDIFETAQSVSDLALAYNNWGLICTEQGYLDRASEYFERARAGFVSIGNQKGEAKTITNLGEVYRRMGDWDAAAACYHHAMELHQYMGDEFHAASQKMNLSIIFFHHQALTEAVTLSLEAEEVLRRVRHRGFLARTCNNHGIFLTALGRLDEAQLAFDEAVRLHLETGERLYAADALNNCAEVLVTQAKLSDARTYLARALALLDTLPSPPAWIVRDHTALVHRLEAIELEHDGDKLRELG